MFTRKKLLQTAILLCAVLLSAKELVTSEDRILFIGDSITQFGNYPEGYIQLIAEELKHAGIKSTIIPRGISAQTSKNMAARITKELADNKPTWLVLSCGVNDVNNGISYETFVKNYTSILDAAQKTDCRILLMTLTPIGENLKSKKNVAIRKFNDFIWQEGTNRKCLVAEVYSAMAKQIKSMPETVGLKVTTDYLHMNGYGNRILAVSILRSWQFSDKKIQAAILRWNKRPSMMPIVNNFFKPTHLISINEYSVIDKEAGKKGLSVETYLKNLIRQHAEELRSKYTPVDIDAIKAALPGEVREDKWRGFKRLRFKVAGCNAWLVLPENHAKGKPWSWCTEFPDAFTERCCALELLKAGFCHAHIQVGNTFGAPEPLKKFVEFHKTVTKTGLAPKAVLIGISRGGLYAYRFASENPEKVALIYGDAPVCDFKSWPAGWGEGSGSSGDWKKLKQCYGFVSDEDARSYNGNPVDILPVLAKAKIPLVHVVGMIDKIVPPAENTDIVEERYKKLGGEIKVFRRPEAGHHPHGLDDSKPVVEFILKHLIN